MTNSEKFCLRWNDFETNISAAFRELRDDKDFFDVTLACDDSQLQAHKVILSACSPFFRNILRKNPHQHPLLYLKGVKFKELVSVLNFMYMGEVNVAQDELNSFLSVAEELNVKGLTQNNSSDSAKPDKFKSNNNRFGDPSERDLSSAPPSKKIRPASISGTVPISNVSPAQHTVVPGQDDIQEVVPVKSEPRDSTTVPPTQQPVVLSREDSKQNYQHQEPGGGQQQGTVALQDNYQEDGYEYEGYEGYDDGSYDQTTGQPGRADGNKVYEDEIYSKMYRSEHGLWMCTVCGKGSKVKNNIYEHIEAVHVESPGYACNICNRILKTKNTLRNHTILKHKNFS